MTVEPVAVQVPALQALRAWANESIQHEPMHGMRHASAANVQRHPWVSVV